MANSPETEAGAIALGASELGATLDALREGVQVLDRSWRYAWLNQAAAEHGRNTREALLGRSIFECYPSFRGTDAHRAAERAMVGESAALRNLFTYPDGRTATFELRIHPCERGVVILSIDLTESLETERRLQEARKMEAIGRLCGSVAHDFNNLLSIVLASARFVQDTVLDPVARTDVEAIVDASRKAGILTRQIVVLGRPDLPPDGAADLDAVLAELDPLLRRVLGRGITLDLALGAGAVVELDQSHLEQIVVNLVTNARDAIGTRGGRVAVATAVRSDDGEQVAELVVADDGVGMSPETRERVFEPYFTTKGRGGSGLGLSTVYALVRNAGGSVSASSEPGRGATFRVRLPVGERVAAERVTPPPDHDRLGSETVLVVEDDDALRAVTCRALRRHGYHVLEAANAGEAWMVVDRDPSVDLLLADLVLPRISGAELAGRLRERLPTLRVVLVSGAVEGAILADPALGADAVLQKPLLPDLLLDVVRATLDR